jgi:predicted aspartyl protease
MTPTPTIELEVIGARQAVQLTAIADTGFDGDVCLTTGIAVSLGLELVERQLVELADGTQKDELVFAGEIRMLGQRHAVKIFLTNSDDTLVGTRLLGRYALSIEFPSGQVKVPSAGKPRERRKRRTN